MTAGFHAKRQRGPHARCSRHGYYAAMSSMPITRPALVASVVSGEPSTAHVLWVGRDPRPTESVTTIRFRIGSRFVQQAGTRHAPARWVLIAEPAGATLPCLPPRRLQQELQWVNARSQSLLRLVSRACSNACRPTDVTTRPRGPRQSTKHSSASPAQSSATDDSSHCERPSKSQPVIAGPSTPISMPVPSRISPGKTS